MTLCAAAAGRGERCLPEPAATSTPPVFQIAQGALTAPVRRHQVERDQPRNLLTEQSGPGR
jgi:hypothetical protein